MKSLQSVRSKLRRLAVALNCDRTSLASDLCSRSSRKFSRPLLALVSLFSLPQFFKDWNSTAAFCSFILFNGNPFLASSTSQAVYSFHGGTPCTIMSLQRSATRKWDCRREYQRQIKCHHLQECELFFRILLG